MSQSINFDPIRLPPEAEELRLEVREFLAEEIKESGPKFNSLSLGSVNTPMLNKAFPGYKAQVNPNEMASFIFDFANNVLKFSAHSWSNDAHMALYRSTGPKLQISPDQNVAPQAMLVVSGDASITGELRVAGDAMDQAIISYMRQKFNLLIGEASAEKIKKEIGTAIPTNNNTYAVKGRDLRSGTPKEVNITEEDTAEALNDILKQMVNGIKDALESTPPELSADLVDMGLVLTGGGALLKNIDKRFSKETGLPVHIADDPLSCVAVGTGKALDQEQTFSTMLTEY